MGSTSDWETMLHAVKVLEQFNVPHEVHIVSAHRTPDWMTQYAKTAQPRGLQVIIAGADGATRLPSMDAAQTHIPVLGVPVQSQAPRGRDSFSSIAPMPTGMPEGALTIGKAVAANAGLLAIAILATSRPELREALRRYRNAQVGSVSEASL